MRLWTLCEGFVRELLKSKWLKTFLRSLPPRLDPKITAFEESEDVERLDVDKLVGFLITYESKKFSSKARTIVLKTSKKEKEVVHEESSDDESSDSKPIAMITRNFHKYLKHSKWSGRRSSELPFKGESRRIQEINPTGTRKLAFLNAIRVRDMVTSGLNVETWRMLRKTPWMYHLVMNQSLLILFHEIKISNLLLFNDYFDK